MSKEIAKAKATDVGEVYDYGEDAGGGFEDVTADDLQIPFLNVMQSGSKEVEEQTIQGVKAGDIVNSVTKEIMKQPFSFQPVYREEQWVEWIPRLKGGGLVDQHEPDSDIVLEVIRKNGGTRMPPKDEEGKRVGLKYNGNELVETYYVYGLILDEDGDSIEGMGVLAFSSSKITPYRKWLTSMFQIKGAPPLWSQRARISTAKQKNAAGQPYFNFSIMPFGTGNWKDGLINPRTDEGAYQIAEGKKFKVMVDNGLARADMGGAEGNTGGTGETGSGKASDGGEAAPF